MKDTSKEIIHKLVQDQNEYFATNETKNVKFRIKQLRKLRFGLQKYQTKLEEALWKDLHKSSEEAFFTEFSLVYAEIDNHITNLEKWTKSEKVKTPIHLQPSKSRIDYEPMGVALIISPWNYPVQLTMAPLIGAISAGCCAVVKPSPDSSETSLVMQEMLEKIFESKYITVVQGHRDTNEILLHEEFDVFFFTGSSKVGKIVMEAASKQLIPVILELGGKSPCIVDKDANLEIAAKRIIWGKLINAGQTCVAPDYMFVHTSIKDELLQLMSEQIYDMYGENVQESKYYPRIITQEALKGLIKYLDEGTIHTGGEYDLDDKYMAPTIIDEVKPDFKVMQKEIFGPILPVLTFDSIDEPIQYVKSHPRPLAFYYFGDTEKAKDVINRTAAGGGCVNDTLLHVSNHHMPFGGINYSGIGKYHGHDSFLAFSNRRSTMETPTWMDIPMKYPPFKYFDAIKNML